MLTFYLPGKGFLHTVDGSGSNQMASEQGYYGLIAAYRAMENKYSLYRMTDFIEVEEKDEGTTKPNQGLLGKNKDVNVRKITSPGKTFNDLSGHPNKKAIEELASRQIVAGKGGNDFEPDSTLTRAELAAIVVKSLGLQEKVIGLFVDVPIDSWYVGAVDTAFMYDLVNGTSSTENIFLPQNEITREQAAGIITNVAKLAGMNTETNSSSVRDVLAQFSDYATSSDWARESLAFCYSNDILDQSDIYIRPKESIKRGEMAEMLFRMLKAANLI